MWLYCWQWLLFYLIIFLALAFKIKNSMMATSRKMNILYCKILKLHIFLLPQKKVKENKVAQCVQLFATPWTGAHQAPPSIEFSRQEYWSGLPFPSPGDLPDPGIEPRSPTLWADTLPSEPPGKPCCLNILTKKLWTHLPGNEVHQCNKADSSTSSPSCPPLTLT